jgi:hypothetical protein
VYCDHGIYLTRRVSCALCTGATRTLSGPSASGAPAPVPASSEDGERPLASTPAVVASSADPSSSRIGS